MNDLLFGENNLIVYIGTLRVLLWKKILCIIKNG